MINASASGGTTEGGLERLPPHLKRRIDILILELGINDVFHGLSVDQIQNNLQQIIDRVKARNPNVRVVIAGMQLPGHAADDYVSAFGKMFTDLAEKKWSGVGAVFTRRRGRQSLIEFSPMAFIRMSEGQKILAENVWRVLEPVAREGGKVARASGLRR